MPTYTEPVTLQEVKSHLNIDPDYEMDDALLLTYIKSGREYMEGYLNLGLVERTVTENFRACCSSPIGTTRLKYGPVTKVIAITDLKGSNANLFNHGSYEFPEFYLNYGVDITYTAGYTPQTIPANLKEALMLIVGNSYDNKGESIKIPQQAYQKMSVSSRNVF